MIHIKCCYNIDVFNGLEPVDQNSILYKTNFLTSFLVIHYTSESAHFKFLWFFKYLFLSELLLFQLGLLVLI